MASALEGIRVIDMTGVLLGPAGSQILGDLGADVIKVESPAGDTTRSVGHSRHEGMASLFLHTNRNKRSLAIDLKRPEGLAVLRKLLETADVLFHNMRPQAMARLGLSYEEVRRIRPDIVYCGAFGYGQGGRYAKRPAYDDLIQGAVALPDLFGRLGVPPCYIPAAFLDRLTALTAVYSIIAALLHRQRTGEGQSIEIPMFETIAQMILAEHLGGRSFEPPIGPMGYSRLLSPYRRPYRTSDGYVCALMYTDRHWRRFFEAVGRADLSDSPKFRTLAERNRHIDEIYQIAEAAFLEHETAHWVDLLDDLEIPVVPLNTLESLMDDPHLADVGFFETVDHPTEGPIRSMPQASRWSRTQPSVRRQAPRLGGDSAEILAEAGYSAAEIEGLQQEGVVRVAD